LVRSDGKIQEVIAALKDKLGYLQRYPEETIECIIDFLLTKHNLESCFTYGMEKFEQLAAKFGLAFIVQGKLQNLRID